MRINKYALAGIAGGVAVAIAISRRVAERQPKPPPRGDHDGWHRAPLASLDFETTGIDPLNDRVLSYALISDVGPDVNGLINPGIPIPASSAEVHGITDVLLADAPPPAIGIAIVVEWVQQLIDRGVGLVVFNAAYDLSMLHAEATRWGVPQPDWDRLLVVDPYVIDWGILRGTLGSRKLTDVAAYYSVPLDNAHDAAADARAARGVAYEVGARHPYVAANTLVELMARQRSWFADRAEDWNAYARTVDRPLNDPDGWPLASVLTSPT
ncbi:3'-5' exonuclease [Aeromicrobium panaciterrae]|uniref:exonuclease domain-containing protein n=1 Tax=Aeromicrobium panaciterrae TaxID=363861 RepID=UPI0031DCE35B